MNNVDVRKPIIKWVGGKSKLIPVINMHQPPDFYRVRPNGRFYEPFFGGGAYGLHRGLPNSVFADYNPALMAMYRGVRNFPEEVMKNLVDLASQWNYHPEERKKFYKAKRKWFNGAMGNFAKMHDPHFAAVFIFLNKAGFNGLYRVNKDGRFNVPMGDDKSKNFYNEAHLRTLSARMHFWEFRTGSYEETTEDACCGDWVFCDPPYVPIDDNFVGYTSDGFDHKAFAEYTKDLIERGCNVMVCNSYCPKTAELYEHMRLFPIMSPRSVGADASTRGVTWEYIITNYIPAHRNEYIKGIKDLYGIPSPEKSEV